MWLYRPVFGRWPKSTYGRIHQGLQEEKSISWLLRVFTGLGRRQVQASLALGVERCRASAAMGVAHLEGITNCPENVLWPRWCHPPIPTDSNDRGGGDIDEGGTVEAWRRRASVCQEVSITVKGGFKATPSVPVKRAPIHDLSAHEV